jgi:hypothetical protein
MLTSPRQLDILPVINLKNREGAWPNGAAHVASPP